MIFAIIFEARLEGKFSNLPQFLGSAGAFPSRKTAISLFAIRCRFWLGESLALPFSPTFLQLMPLGNTCDAAVLSICGHIRPKASCRFGTKTCLPPHRPLSVPAFRPT